MKLNDLVHYPMAGETNFTLDEILFMGKVETLVVVYHPDDASQAEALKKEMSESRNSRVSSIVVHCVPFGKPEPKWNTLSAGIPILFEKAGITESILLDTELMIVEEKGKIIAMRYTDFPSTIALSKRYFGRM